MEEQALKDKVIEEIQDKNKIIICPFCKKEGTGNDYLFSITQYYFACPACGGLFMTLSIVNGLMEMVKFKNKIQKEKNDGSAGI